jgi:hypothetical protein
MVSSMAVPGVRTGQPNQRLQGSVNGLWVRAECGHLKSSRGAAYTGTRTMTRGGRARHGLQPKWIAQIERIFHRIRERAE